MADEGKKRGRQTLSKAELRERVEFVAKLLARRLVRSDVERIVVAKYGVTTRTCDAYISSAKEVLATWTGKSKPEHRVAALLFYESIIQSDAPLGHRITAQCRIDRLLGLEAPLQLRHGQDDEAGPVRQVTEVIVRTREEAQAILKRDQQNTAGGPGAGATAAPGTSANSRAG